MVFHISSISLLSLSCLIISSISTTPLLANPTLTLPNENYRENHDDDDDDDDDIRLLRRKY